MKGIWKRQPLGRKLRLILGFTSAIAIFGMILGLAIFREVYKRFDSMIRVSNRIELLVNQISDQLHTASREEFAYIVNRKQEALILRESAFQAIEKYLQDIQAIQQDLIPAEDLNGFSADIKAYQTEFKTIVELLNVEGSLQDGLLGVLRQANNDIENGIKSNPGSDQGKAMTLYLNVRRQRTDYMASRNPDFLTKAANELNAFHVFLQNSQGFSKAEKEKLRATSQLYVDTLVKVNLNYVEMMTHRGNQEKLLSSVEKAVKTLGEQLARHNTEQFKTLENLASLARIIFAAALSISFILVLLSSWEFERLTRRLSQIVDSIYAAVELASKTSDALGKNAERTLKDSQRQAKDIEETTSTLQGLAKTVVSNVHHVHASLKKAEETAAVADRGKTMVQQMRQHVQYIETAVQNMLHQSQETNQQVAGISTIIGKIQDHTRIIESIVFQTRILSFNASVEASRAGEQGRGFSVVAEEVGALAGVSGKASQEIAAMLKSSQTEVLSIINSSQERSTELMEAGRSQVEQGIVVADNCTAMLGEIVEQVNEMLLIMKQIHDLVNFEAADIGLISQAMLDVKKVANANSDAAHQVSETSSVVNANARQLTAIVGDLSNLVFGARSEAQPKPRKRKEKVKEDPDPDLLAS